MVGGWVWGKIMVFGRIRRIIEVVLNERGVSGEGWKLKKEEVLFGY